MSIVHMSVYRHYWATETRYAPIVDAMTLTRYEQLRRFLHVNDNSKKGEDENRDDKIFKIRPVLDLLRARCNTIYKEHILSIDEQIVPAKTKRSCLRQYNPRKPVKWGFKMFVLSGTSGVMYDFFLYCGAESNTFGDSSARSCVLELCKIIPKYKNCLRQLVLFARVITGAKKYLTASTVRRDWGGKCPLASISELKKEGRGAVDYRVDLNTGLRIVKWLDSNDIHLVSTYDMVEPMTEVKRWDKVKNVSVPWPAVVKPSNSSMGGVDLSDMLVYRVQQL